MATYKEIGHALQIEGNKTHVDTDFVSQFIIVPGKSEITKTQGISLFNTLAELNDLDSLQDPAGYMVLDDSLYDYLHESYEKQYQEHADMIDAGLMAGGSYGMNAVLNKLNPTIRHDITPYLPDKSVKYSDLRFMKATPDMKKTTDNFVQQRVRLTYSHGIKRSVEESTFDLIKNNMKMYGEQLETQIAVSAGLVEEQKPNKLSKKDLLNNSNNNEYGFKQFASQLSEPESITKSDTDEHATASFKTSDIKFAKFLLSNKKYLKPFGFDIVKSNGIISTQWKSDNVDKMYEEKKNVNLDLSDLNSSSESLTK